MKKIIVTSAALAVIPFAAIGVSYFAVKPDAVPQATTSSVHAAYATTPVAEAPGEQTPATANDIAPTEQVIVTPTVTAPVATPQETADMRVTDKDQRLCFNLLIERGYGWDTMTSDKVNALLDYIGGRYVSVCGAWYQVQSIAPVKVREML